MTLNSRSWPEVSFGEIFDISSSKRVLQSQWKPQGVPFYRAREIVKLARDGTVNNELFITEELYVELAKKFGVPVAGDLMISAVGTLGACYQVQPHDRFYFKDASVLRFHPKEELCSRFFWHTLQTHSLKQQIHSGSGSTVGTLTISRANELRTLLPPLDEQKRIAAILDKADQLRQKRRQAISLLDSLTQSIFLEMFGTAAPDWPTVELRDAVKQGTIVTYGIVQAGEEFEGGVPYIRTGDIQKGSIISSGLRHTDPEIASKFSRSRVEAGEIVMSIRATVGTTALVPLELHGANLTQGTARIAPGEDFTSEYFLHYLRSGPIQNWIERQVKGATFREITLSRLRELKVIVPPMQLQMEFSDAILKLRQTILRAQESFAKQELLFASLQHRAFSGQL